MRFSALTSPVRLAALAILVAVLIAYANHMVRVGIASRREAARFLPDASRPIRLADSEKDQIPPLPPFMQGRVMATSIGAVHSMYVDWAFDDDDDASSSAKRASGRPALPTLPGVADTADGR
jgi:hypothetical protein